MCEFVMRESARIAPSTFCFITPCATWDRFFLAPFNKNRAIEIKSKIKERFLRIYLHMSIFLCNFARKFACDIPIEAQIAA